MLKPKVVSKIFDLGNDEVN